MHKQRTIMHAATYDPVMQFFFKHPVQCRATLPKNLLHRQRHTHTGTYKTDYIAR